MLQGYWLLHHVATILLLVAVFWLWLRILLLLLVPISAVAVVVVIPAAVAAASSSAVVVIVVFSEIELDNVILLHVEGNTEEIKLRVQEKMNNRIQEKAEKDLPNIEIVRSRIKDLPDDQQNQVATLAREYNVSVGKMIYILKLDRIDNNKEDKYTLNELARMNMRNLHSVELELDN